MYKIKYFQSHFVNNSLYSSDWLSLSPRFRRLMLFAMLRWSKPITLRTAYIFPLSLNTFIGVRSINNFYLLF